MRVSVRSLAFCGVFLASAAVRAQDVTSTIGFDDLPVQTVVTTQYVQQGTSALFHRAIIQSDGSQPGNRILSAEILSTEFPSIFGMTIDFQSAQRSVSLAGSFFLPPSGPVPTSRLSEGKLEAFDAAGNLVATHGPLVVASNNLSVTFSVSTAGNIIQRVVFTSLPPTTIGGENEIIDNLQFTGDPPPPPTGGAPDVVLATPSSGVVDLRTVLISGTVTGTNLLQPAILSIDFQAQPPNLPHLEREIFLTSTSDPNAFTFSFVQEIPPGTVTLTVFVESVFGLSDSAQAVLINLPGDVLGQCTPTGPLGAFQYGIELGTCTLNVCANGAVSSHAASGTSHVMPAAMIAKWLTVNDTRLGGNLGCPVSDAAATSSMVPAVRQDFERGRLYDAEGTVSYVPAVFAQAMAVSGEETGVGVPTSDPTVNTLVSDVETMWYQRFERLVTASDLGTTMEIRGEPPVLSVARQGGDLQDLLAVASFSEKTATLWDRFPCTGAGPWTCQSAPPQPHVDPDPNFVASIQSACSGDLPQVCVQDYDPTGLLPSACTNAWPVAPAFSVIASSVEWPPLPDFQQGSNYAFRDLLGWVRAGRLSSTDFPLTHTYTFDYTIDVRPFAPYDGLFLANVSDRNLHTEIEWHYFLSFWQVDLPDVGDLFFANGRWIVDCGHPPFPSELHPMGVMALMRTRPSGFLGLAAPLTTYALITANGFFRGALTTVRIEPPPRPSPNSQLFVVMPRDSGTEVGGITVNSDVFFDHVDVTFSRTTPITQDTVSKFGEMFWPAGIGSYTGQWEVGWTQ